ncbi:MAG: hypothetical protein E6J91_31065, partial [Deltaproteobacteria bacterium]
MRQKKNLPVGESGLAYHSAEEPRLMADRDLSGRKLGEYILREQIGEGGYGVVYRGEQPLLERDVVVKVLHAQRSDDDSRKRFLREARLAAQLRHPCAAQIYASGAEDQGSLLWIAMERIEGVSLDAWLNRHGPMPLEQFVPFFERVCEVVDAAHERGIVHRDLKPSNIMVVECRDRLLPKLVDFGIAKDNRRPEIADRDDVKADPLAVRPRRDRRTVACHPESWRQLTLPGACLGSRPYMAPEQWIGADDVGPEADIYALGVVAYQTLTGRLPFVADRSDDYFEQHRRAPVPRLGDGFPLDLDPAIRCALDKYPRARYRSALELVGSRRTRGRPAQHSPGDAQPAGVLVRRGEPAANPTYAVGSTVARRARRSGRDRRVPVPRSDADAAGDAAGPAGPGPDSLGPGGGDGDHHAGRARARPRSVAPQRARCVAPSRSRLPARRPLTEYGVHARSCPGAQVGRAGALHEHVRAHVVGRVLSGWATDRHDRRQGRTGLGRADQPAEVHAVPRRHGVSGPVQRRGALVRELRAKGARLRYYIVALSSDGKLVAAIDAKGDVAHVWDAITGALVAEIRNDGLESSGLAFSPDGRWLATTGGSDVHVLDTRTWRPATAIRGPRIHRLAFDPTGSRLVTGATTGATAIWAIPSGTRIRHLRDVGEPVDAVAFSPDGELVVAASRDGAEQVWRARSGELQSQLNPRHSKILAVEFDRTSRLVLAAGADGSVVVVDAALGMPVAMLEGPQNVLVAHFDPSSRRVVGASLDGTARVWEVTSPYHRWSSPPVSDNCGIVTSPEPDRRFIAVGCRGRATRVWDTARDQLIIELPSVSHVEGDFTSAFPAVSGTGDRAAIARGNTVEVYELPGGRLRRTIAHRAAVNAVAFGGTGRDIISGAVDGSLLVTRDDGARLALPASPGGIDIVESLPDGRLVSSDAQRRLRVYDPGGAILADLEIPTRAMSLRAEGARLVAVPI